MDATPAGSDISATPRYDLVAVPADQDRGACPEGERRLPRRRDAAQRLRAERVRLQQRAAELADREHALEKRRREIEAQADLSRRQLNAAWQRLRREEAACQEQHRRREFGLQTQQQLLDQRLNELQSAEAAGRQLSDDLAQTQSQRERELRGLEGRVRHYRQHLLRLQQETTHLEGRIGDVAGHEKPAEARRTATAYALPWLNEIGEVIQDLLDQNQRLEEYQDQLVRLREAWQDEWERIIAALTERERAIQEQEQRVFTGQRALRHWSETLQHQADELAIRQRQYRAWEARLLQLQSAFRCEEARAHARAQARTEAALSRHRKASRLLVKAALRHRCALDLYRRLAAKLREERMTLHTRAAILDQREASLFKRERDVGVHELILCQAHQQLLAQDPRPVEADQELRRRMCLVEERYARPLSRLRQKEAEAVEIHDALEEFRQELLADQDRLLALQHDLEFARAKLDREKLGLEVQRDQMNQELVVLRADRERLQEHVCELNDQLERLTLLLMDVAPPGPQVGMAA